MCAYTPFNIAYLVKAGDKAIAKNSGDGDGFLDIVLSSKSKVLTDSISLFQDFRDERQKMSDLIRRDIEYSLMYLSMDISGLDFWPGGVNSAADSRRIHLERLSRDLEQERWREEKDCWNDMLSVSRSLHDLLKEYADLEIRKRIIND